MNIGIGLPNAVPGRTPGLLVEWAERAESGPFTSLGVVDRIAYPSLEPLGALAAASAATSRIGLVTMIVISPLRSVATLAKQALSVDALSEGRLTVGVAVGARREDYAAAAVDHRGRGSRFADQITRLRDEFESGGVGPLVRAGGPPIIAGGTSDRALARAARYADGYVHGGGPPRTFTRAVAAVRAAWADSERPGAPLLWAQGYFALGRDARERGLSYMRDYYAFTGPLADRLAEGLLTTPQQIVQFAGGYLAAGCGELVLLPAIAEIEQVDRLADVVGAIG